jgi:hypothetical protein
MDEFNTINVGRQQMARELELLRQRYLGHRETLVRLEADAPSEELAARYRALQQEIDDAVHKLGELASGEPAVKRTQPASGRIPAMVAPVAAATASAATPSTPSTTSSIADRPLHTSTRTSTPSSTPEPIVEPEDKKRLIYIVTAAALMLMILALLIWRSRRNDGATPVVEETPAAAVTATEAPVESVADSGVLSVNPASHDFGTIRKGTRAVRQFRVENSSDQPVAVSIDRSTCRCLWFDFDSSIPAKSSSILAITVDGAKAKAGALEETVTIKNKGDADDSTTIRLMAKIE